MTYEEKLKAAHGYNNDDDDYFHSIESGLGRDDHSYSGVWRRPVNRDDEIRREKERKEEENQKEYEKRRKFVEMNGKQMTVTKDSVKWEPELMENTTRTLEFEVVFMSDYETYFRCNRCFFCTPIGSRSSTICSAPESARLICGGQPYRDSIGYFNTNYARPGGIWVEASNFRKINIERVKNIINKMFGPL